MTRMERQLEQIRQAYDLTVEQYRRGTDELAQVPEAFKQLLTPLFAIDHSDSSHVTLKYFARAIRGMAQRPLTRKP